MDARVTILSEEGVSVAVVPVIACPCADDGHRTYTLDLSAAGLPPIPDNASIILEPVELC